VLVYYAMSYYTSSSVSEADPVTWRSRVAVRARPAQVIEVLTDPQACARWSPVGFDVHGLDGDRLRRGSSATVTGALHGWPMRFAIEVMDVRGDRFRLRAVGPVEMLVDYAVRPVGRGSTVDAAISVIPRTGPGSALTARLTGLLLRGGALHHALRRMGNEAERQSKLIGDGGRPRRGPHAVGARR
jgi:polyketide cyclase/dehydrase/lipid transport protein